MDRRAPVRRFHLRRPPAFFRNHAVHFEVFGPRTEIEPFTSFENDAANLSALGDPISENWNERYLLLCRNTGEYRWAPHRDVGKVVFARNAVSIRNIDHLIFAKGDCRTQAGLAEREGNVVPSI